MANFQIGQKVRYGQSGVCEIQEIALLNTGRGEASYYVLAPLFKKGSTVYVPCDNEELTEKMRPLLTPDEIHELLAQVRKAPCPWNRDFRKRSEESRQALSSPNRLDALILIKSILKHKKELVEQGKHVHTTDDYFLRDAELLIYNEIAFVLHQSFDEVEDHVHNLLSSSS